MIFSETRTPLVPITKQVFTLEELSFLADLIKEHDAYAMLDEVYEHLVYPGEVAC